MASARIILVRHGESDVTVRRVVGGERTCTGLSPLGVRQAEALRDRLARERPFAVDALISSTLPRAAETADIIAPAVGAPVRVCDPELVEHRPGIADGLTFVEFQARYPTFDFRAEPDRPIAPGGESLNEFTARVLGALERIEAAHVGATVMVVCHGGVIEVIFREYLGVGFAAPFDLWTLNTSITDFERCNPRWLLRRYNDAAHLAGLPEKTNATNT